MTSQPVTLPSQAAAATRISQATAVEQSRAVAEVAAAVRVALEFPRDEEYARAQMQRACSTMQLAQRAFYSVPNRGQGPSVHLARELARCWGNVQHGMVELKRDDAGGESEMQAFAWDVQHNSRSVRSFINPHVRMAGGSRKALTDVNDIVNQNNNAASRAVRETIYNILPVDFVEEAKRLCNETLERGDGESLSVRIEKAVAAFARIDVTPAQLEARLSRERGRWDAQDVASLLVLWQSLSAGDTTKADEFPGQHVTADELVGTSRPDGAGAARPEAVVEHGQHDEGGITDGQQKKMRALFGKVDLTDRDEQLAYYERVTGRAVESSKALSKFEAGAVIEDLEAAEKGEPNRLDQAPADTPDPADGNDPWTTQDGAQ